MPAAEVIDLTVSPIGFVVEIGNDDIKSVPNPNDFETGDGSTRKRKKSKREKGKGKEKARDARRTSMEREEPQKKRRKLNNSKHDRDDHNAPSGSHQRSRSLTPPLPFFTFDATPSTSDPAILMPSHPDPPLASMPPSNATFHNIEGLLLPSHVTVVAEDNPSHLEDTNIRALSPLSDVTGIDFVDDDKAFGAPRYFESADSTAKIARPCKNCGETGHDARDCTIVVCFTCGARNDHISYSCPALRVCFRCQGKGHLSRDCPRIGSMEKARLDQECDRCGSQKHHHTNCPTLWRIYTYLTDEERKALLSDRMAKKDLKFEDGGEGYIARDHWCYNCSRSGHLGDDCPLSGVFDKPDEYTAFGNFNLLTGPFASAWSPIPHVNRPTPPWEGGDDSRRILVDGNVGRKSREKARQRAVEAQRRFEDEDDEPDWFSTNMKASKTDDKRSAPSNTSKNFRPTFNYNSNKPDSTRSSGEGKGKGLRISLYDRIDMGQNGLKSGSSSRVASGNDRNYDRGRDRSRDDRRRDDHRRYEREWDKDRERDRYRNEDRRERGSRWRGGYSPR